MIKLGDVCKVFSSARSILESIHQWHPLPTCPIALTAEQRGQLQETRFGKGGDKQDARERRAQVCFHLRPFQL